MVDRSEKRLKVDIQNVTWPHSIKLPPLSFRKNSLISISFMTAVCQFVLFILCDADAILLVGSCAADN